MWFDIICLLIIIAGIIFGYKRGILVQMGKFVGIITGIICCNIFSDALANKFSSPYDDFGDILLNQVMAYAIIFLVCYIAGSCLGTFFSKFTRKLHLGILDKLAGALFNILEYVLGFSILVNVWIAMFPDSKIHTNYTGVKEFVIDFAPKVLGSETVGDFFESMDKTIHTATNAIVKENDATKQEKDSVLNS